MSSDDLAAAVAIYNARRHPAQPAASPTLANAHRRNNLAAMLLELGHPDPLWRGRWTRACDAFAASPKHNGTDGGPWELAQLIAEDKRGRWQDAAMAEPEQRAEPRQQRHPLFDVWRPFVGDLCAELRHHASTGEVDEWADAAARLDGDGVGQGRIDAGLRDALVRDAHPANLAVYVGLTDDVPAVVVRAVG